MLIMEYRDKGIQDSSSTNFYGQKSIRTGRFEVESNDEEEPDALTRIERRRHRRFNETKHPMSIEKRGNQIFLSKELGEKYTLRTHRYVPFSQRSRDLNREQRALEKRGGVDEMEKFIYIRQEREEQERLEREARENAVDLENFENIEPDTSLKRTDESNHPTEYEKELEKMEENEENELDELISNLKLR